MKFKLIIDESAADDITLTVKKLSPLTDKIEELVNNYRGSDKITVQTKNSIKQLAFSDIECITVIDGKVCVIATSGERFDTKMRLYELEDLLPSSFIRINKSTIANKERLERFSAGYSGSVNAVFKSGYTDYVSRRCFAKIKKGFLI